MDFIEIDSLSAWGKHGVYAEEREKAQEFILSARMWFNARTAGASDDLADTIDYRDVRAVMLEIVEGSESSQLIEHLAERIASRILKDARIQKVEVTIRKPMWDNGLPSITITRGQ